MTDHPMFDLPPKAPPEIIEAREALAGQAIQALRRAGLPAFRDGETPATDRAGAVVYVDSDADTASAPVYMSWRCDPAMLGAAVDSLTSGDPDAPVVRYPGMISLHMQGALINILLSSGVSAAPDNDAMNPDHVLVFGTTSDPTPAPLSTPAPETP
ncbi:hypothetical protein [Streptomyces sp. NBC_00986]|uniref:hypothetical protein n=1 Tax=Streptomyces sp. NBC_00986 TaxID=2903702 RepID=UPI0038642ADF|nr:hypothetical protein OG504_22470 [Streptomyces sp. NBC_00986]